MVCCILCCQIIAHLLQSVVHIVSVKNAFFKQIEQCIFIVSIRLHRCKFYFGFIIIVVVIIIIIIIIIVVVVVVVSWQRIEPSQLPAY